MSVIQRKSIKTYVDTTPEQLNNMTKEQLLNAIDDLSYYATSRKKRFENAYAKFIEKYPSAPISQAYTQKSPLNLAIIEKEKYSELTAGALRHQFRIYTNFLSTKTSTFSGYKQNLSQIKKSFFNYANDNALYSSKLKTSQIDRFFKIYRGIAHTAEEVGAGGKYEVWRMVKEFIDKEKSINIDEMIDYINGSLNEGEVSTLLKKLINYQVSGKNELTKQEAELLELYGYIEGGNT